MANDVVFGIRVKMDGTVELSNGVRRVSDGITGIGKTSKQAESSAASLAESLKRVGHYGAGLVGLNIGASLARDIVRAADAMTNLQSRLRLVTGSTAELALAQQSIVNIAQATRQSLEATGDVYFKMAKGAETLGLSQTQVIALTGTISQAVALSGASAESAKAALMQFGQALASGALRGDELNSVMEQTPALAEAIAKGMGKSVGELRKMGEAGEITVKQIIDALNKSAPEIARQFGQLTPTVGSAFQQLSNSTTVFIGQLDRVFGASHALASSLQFVASNFEGFATAGLAVASVGLGGFVGKAVQARQAAAALAAEQAAAATASRSLSAALGMQTAQVAASSTALTGARAVIGALGGPVGALITLLSLGVTAWFAFGSSAKDAAKKSSDAIARIRQNAIERGKDDKESLQEALASTNKQIQSGYAEYGAAKSPSEKSAVFKRLDLGGLSKHRADIEAQIKLIDEREKNLAARTAGMSIGEGFAKLYQTQAQKRKDAIAELDKAYLAETDKFKGNQEKQLQLAAGYATKRAQIDKQFADKKKGPGTSLLENLQEEIEKVGQGEYAMLRLKAAHDGVSASAEPLIVRLQQTRAAHQDLIDRQEAQTRATDNEIERLNRLEEALSAAQGAANEFARARADEAAQLKFELSLIGKSASERNLATEARRRELEMRKNALEIPEEVTTGTGEEKRPRDDFIKQAQAANADYLQTLAQSEAATRSFETGAKNAFATYAEEAGYTAKNAAEMFGKAFKGMEDALVNFVMTGKLNFSDLARSVIADLVRMQVQQSITKPLFASMQRVFGFATGGVMTADGPLPLHAYASGGIASRPQLALFGEGSMPEAFVPLPDGRRIPVKLEGQAAGAAGNTYHVSVAVDASGSRVQGDAAGATELGRRIEGAVRRVLVDEKRPGGLLAS